MADIEDESESGDILDIIIIPEVIEGASSKRDKNLQDLHNSIRNYMRSNEYVVKEPDYERRSRRGKTHYHPFEIIAPNGCAYPGDRSFKIRITYATTSIGVEHAVTLKTGEKSTDFETIFINDTQKEFRDAETRSKAFIDLKIKEVHDKYKNDPGNMSDI